MTDFPKYRKLSGFERYYRISDERHFTEAFVQQGTFQYLEVHAAQYPEILRIQDMLDGAWNYVEMTEEEILQIFPT